MLKIINLNKNKLKLIIWLNILIVPLLATGITLTSYPTNMVTRNSLQHIAWSVPDGVVLANIKLDIYQNAQYAQTLATITSNAKSFDWSVSQNARIGDNYAIRVTATSIQGKTAWATTPLFNIISNSQSTNSSLNIIAIVFITLICLLIILLIGCFHQKYKSGLALSKMSNTTNYHTMNTSPLPVAQEVNNATYPPGYVANPTQVIIPERRGYSGASMAGAAITGMVGGVLLDEALSNRHSHDRNRNDYFGSGTFGDGGDFNQDTNFGGGF